MTIIKNNNKWDKSNVFFKDNNLIYNKNNPKNNMNYIDYGLSVVNKSIFNLFPDNTKFDLSELFENLSNRDLLAGFEVYDRFYEIGSIKGIKDTINFFKKEYKSK